MTELVIVNVKDGVGELILNRPRQRNALIGPLVLELQRGLDMLVEDDSVKAIVLRGAEGYFCAGLDLRAFAQDPAPDWRHEFQANWAQLHKTFFLANKPVIGALEGFAIAGGSALALACDFLVIGEQAFFHIAEVERGMMAPINIVWLRIRHSYGLALKMALLGQRHYGESLYRLGIADQCVKDADVVPTAHEIAARFVGFDREAVQQLKQSVRAVFYSDASGEDGFDRLLAQARGTA